MFKVALPPASVALPEVIAGRRVEEIDAAGGRAGAWGVSCEVAAIATDWPKPVLVAEELADGGGRVGVDGQRARS